MAKRTISELQKAEEKYRALLDKRDNLNASAAEVRKVRDMLNQQRKEMLNSILEIKKLKDERAAEMRLHKERRNESNAKAKELIGLKRELYRQSADRDAMKELERLTREFESLEMKQQTESMTIQEENELIQRLRGNLAERSKLMDLARKTEVVAGRIDDLNSKIDELFESARKEHELVTALYGEVQALGEQMNAKMNEASILVGEADKRHREYLDIRQEADSVHRQAMEMRQFILERRKERKEQFMEGRRALQQQNESVRRSLLDEEASMKEADRQLEELLKKGKISLR